MEIQEGHVVAGAAAKGKADLADLLGRLGAADQASNQGRYAEARALLEEALSHLKANVADERFVAVATVYLAEACYRGSDFAEAETLALRSLALEAKFPSPTIVKPMALELLGRIYFLIQGKLNDAESLYRQALALFIEVVGAAHPSTANCMTGFGRLCHSRGYYQEAEDLLSRSLAYWRQASPANPRMMAQVMDLIAKLYQTHYRFDEAAELLQQAVTMLEQSLGLTFFGIAYPLVHLGYLCLNHLPGREGEAWAYFGRALSLLETSFGPDSADLAGALDGMATCCLQQKDYRQAERLYQRSLAIVEKVYGRQHRDWAQSISNLANLYYVQDEFERAERLNRQALECTIRALGADHPQTGVLLGNVAICCLGSDRPHEAEIFCRQALTIHERAFGPDHPRLVATLQKYREVLEFLGRDGEAAELTTRIDRLEAASGGESS